jgi:hypothetical protein
MTTDPVTETYNECVDLIRSTVWSFMRYYPWHKDFEELFSQANLYFMQAYITHKNDKGSEFTSWLTNKIWRKLQDKDKNQMRIYKQSLRRPWLPCRELPSEQMIDMLDELKTEGRNLLALYRETYGEFEELFKSKSQPRKHKALYKHLKEQGWTRQEIQRAFMNVKLAVTE